MDVLFRPLIAFFIIELGTQRIVHVGGTWRPMDVWVAQQLREATPFGVGLKYLIRDNDGKYGAHFKRVAAGIKVLRTPVQAPWANAICERFLGSVRCDCLDYLLLFSEAHLRRVLEAVCRILQSNASSPGNRSAETGGYESRYRITVLEWFRSQSSRFRWLAS